MTTEKAIEWYKELTGINLTEISPQYWPDDCRCSINHILEAAKRVELANGELRSRQSISVLISLGELEAKLLG